MFTEHSGVRTGCEGVGSSPQNFELSNIWTKSQKLGKYSSAFLTLLMKLHLVIEWINKVYYVIENTLNIKTSAQCF